MSWDPFQREVLAELGLVRAPAQFLLGVGVLYALSGPVMWFRRRRLDTPA